MNNADSTKKVAICNFLHWISKPHFAGNTMDVRLFRSAVYCDKHSRGLLCVIGEN